MPPVPCRTKRWWGLILLFTSTEKALLVVVVLLTRIRPRTWRLGLTAALYSLRQSTLFRFPQCRTFLFPGSRCLPVPFLVSMWLCLVLAHMKLRGFPAYPRWHSGGTVMHMQLVATTGCTQWKNSARPRAVTRVLLILVLVTTTIPRQWIPETLKLLLQLLLIVATSDLTALDPTTWLRSVCLAPRTPFCSGRTVRATGPWFRTVELFVELFLMTNSLYLLGPPDR